MERTGALRMTTKEVFKNDDIGAFGGRIKVNLSNEGGYTITRVEFVCGSYFAAVDNPEFPLYFKPTREDTKKFRAINNCYLRVYDSNGLRQTASGTMTINANNEVVKENDRLCC